MTAFHLDCDTGIDDALALAYLLGHPGVDLTGIGTVSGNTAAGQAARNTLDLLALAGRDDVPVATGAHHPLGGDFAGGAGPVHGSNGIGGVELPHTTRMPDDRSATDLLIEAAHRHPGELRVITTGPLTNLALALRREPELVTLVHDVTAMGGAVRAPGNITGNAEANIANDPAAAAEVLGAGWPVTLVPLDVTMQHRFTEHDRAALAGHGTPLTAALAAMLTSYFDFYETRFGERQVPLHDPLAAGIATGDLVPLDAPLLGLRIESDGQVVEDTAARHPTKVVFSLTGAAAPVIRTLILEAV
ncbi:nucleoside hydrolase [Actinoplanes friuliensis]|uniref:Purine nucleosidase n=1 Tax=Actinoplanes friuliensis DSM 7358 TaxID=1246995 RepID=U5W111_9ACTN|nr:nucleoside hydrolase [Actinoplanes friuliensis]AGZ42702.1 purine nucleosidase [Actinoplanes friuliensis DSM 7358]